MPEDKELAKNIREAADNLNLRIKIAANAGLKVVISLQEELGCGYDTVEVNSITRRL